MSLLNISDDEIREKLAIIVAEYTSGVRDAVPEQEDREYASFILKYLDKVLGR